MDEQEKAELNKQKKIVDCIRHLNTALDSFDRLEDYKSRVLPIVDGLDLKHSATYFEVTDNLKQELFFIKTFASNAAKSLVEYRRAIEPDKQIYSVKEKKKKAKYGIEPIGDWKKHSEETQSLLDDNKKKIEELLQKQKQRSTEEPEQDLEKVKEKLDFAFNKKKEWQTRRANRITKIEQDVLKLKWAILLLFVLQTAILIKLCL